MKTAAGVAEARAAVTRRTLRMPLRDGVELETVLFLPLGGPHPALLIRTAYSLPNAEDVVRAYVDREGPEALAARGWALVLQDCRGRYQSEGEFRPFFQEVEDGHDTVQWCAAQPWCDGRVVTSAPSYLGITQLMAAASHPPALRAINPQVTVLDPRRYWVREGGALQLHFTYTWAAGWTVVNDDRRSATERLDAQRLLDDLDGSLAQPLATSPLRRLSPAFDTWLRDDDADWAELEAVTRRPPPALPAFHLASWYDLFCEGSLAAYQAYCESARRVSPLPPQRLVVGAWVHPGLGGRMIGEVDFGPEAHWPGEDVVPVMARWLGDALEGREVATGATVFVLGRNRWVDLPSWPPPAEPLRLHLASGGHANSRHGDGVLVAAAPADEGCDHFRYDPHDPVPTRGGRTVAVMVDGGAYDQRAVEDRDDVLVYTGEPLAEELCIMGGVSATVHVASSGLSADVTVKLVDVDPDGRAINLVDSVRRVALQPGLPTTVEVEVGSIAACFAAGHRVRVEISSSNFPRLDRNPSTGIPVAEATELRPADQTVFWGGSRASSISLPVVRGV